MLRSTIEKLRKISIRVIILLLVLIIFLSSFVYITNEVLLEQEEQLDKVILSFLNQNSSPVLTQIFNYLTFFGSTNFLFPAYVIVCGYYLFYKRNSRRSWNIVAVGLSSAAVLHLMKNIFRRPRPETPLTDNFHGFSYPSGHSFSIFTFAGILIYIIWKSELDTRIKWATSLFLFVFSAGVAISRVYLHVHYASDVVAGFLLSISWLIICLYILKWIGRLERTPGKIN